MIQPQFKHRLLLLAAHLESRELGHKIFNFATWNKKDPDTEFDRHGCGTSGCAIGECPIVFPDDWRFGYNNSNIGGQPVTLKHPYSPEQSAKEFFNLTKKEFLGLFMPSDFWRNWTAVNCSPWNKEDLTKNATQYEVAQGIRNFIAWKEREGLS